jgi:hypothetical protein
MFWWSSPARLGALTGILVVSASLTIWGLGGIPDVAAFVGGCALFSIPLLMAWFVFLGFRTSFVPSRGARISRQEDPGTFWFAMACYGLILGFSLYAVWIMFIRD